MAILGNNSLSTVTVHTLGAVTLYGHLNNTSLGAGAWNNPVPLSFVITGGFAYMRSHPSQTATWNVQMGLYLANSAVTPPTWTLADNSTVISFGTGIAVPTVTPIPWTSGIIHPAGEYVLTILGNGTGVPPLLYAATTPPGGVRGTITPGVFPNPVGNPVVVSDNFDIWVEYDPADVPARPLAAGCCQPFFNFPNSGGC